MNPYLERALTKYYSRRRRVIAVFLWASLAACVLIALGVVVLRPEEGFTHPAFVAFELTALISLGICYFSWRAERPFLLEIFRDRPSDVRAVRRGQTTYQLHYHGAHVADKEVTTMFVELADGRRLPIYFRGDLDEFNRLQTMIEKEIAA